MFAVRSERCETDAAGLMPFAVSAMTSGVSRPKVCPSDPRRGQQTLRRPHTQQPSAGRAAPRCHAIAINQIHSPGVAGMYSRDLTQIVATAWQHQQLSTIGRSVLTRRSSNPATTQRFRGSDAGHCPGAGQIPLPSRLGVISDLMIFRNN